MRYVGPRHYVIDGAPTPCPHWEPDQSLRDQVVAIVGSGPQLETFDLSLLKGRRFIVVNSGCRRLRSIATDQDILYFTDNAWNENRPELAKSWPGPVITANRNVKARLQDAVRYIDVIGLTAWMEAFPDHAQASSGHVAACLAARMGARKIVLVAFECQPAAGRTHGHADYTQSDLSAFTDRFIPGWVGLAKNFARKGVEVANATQGSAIPAYPVVDLAEAF